MKDARKIPVIAGADIMAKDGALAALSVDYYKLGLEDVSKRQVLRGALTEGIEEGCFRKDLKPTEVCISWADVYKRQ